MQEPYTLHYTVLYVYVLYTLFYTVSSINVLQPDPPDGWKKKKEEKK